VRSLQGGVGSFVGPLTEQQEAQWRFYEEMLEILRTELATLVERMGE
jgi:hypothetical protein